MLKLFGTLTNATISVSCRVMIRAAHHTLKYVVQLQHDIPILILNASAFQGKHAIQACQIPLSPPYPLVSPFSVGYRLAREVVKFVMEGKPAKKYGKRGFTHCCLYRSRHGMLFFHWVHILGGELIIHVIRLFLCPSWKSSWPSFNPTANILTIY